MFSKGLSPLSRRRAATQLPAVMLLAILPGTANSASAPDAATLPLDPIKPFSEHRLVLQLSDKDPSKHELVIGVAFNMLAAYELDKISIQVVVFADGMELLRADGSSRPLVDSLIVQGVVFNACGATLQTIERKSGRPFPLNPRVKVVPAGVARILDLTEASYTLVRP
jgi:intracellular sulfur oxidation DsrE/DsrF family protein